METYAFLPREAVTAFLMGCPQCSTSNAAATACVAADSLLQPLRVVAAAAADVECSSRIDQCCVSSLSSSRFACSTPLKRETDDNRCAIAVDLKSTATETGADNKENVVVEDNRDERLTTIMVIERAGNKRKRTVPLKRRPVATDPPVSFGTTVNSNSSCTTTVLSSSSSQTDHSGVSRSSGGWWPKWNVRNNCDSRSSGGCSSGGNTVADSSNAMPLDLSSSPLLAISPSPVKTTVTTTTTTTVPPLSSSSSLSPSAADDFFYKRRRVRRRRTKPKRLNNRSSCVGRHDKNRRVVDKDSRNDLPNRCCDDGDGAMDAGNNADESQQTVETDEEDEGPRPAKMKRTLDTNVTATNNNNNNNDDVCFDKLAVSMVTTTVTIKATKSRTEIRKKLSESDESDQVSGHYIISLEE